MKIRQRPSSLILLLIPCLHLTSALLSSEEVVALAEGKQIGPPPEFPGSPGPKPPTVDGIGTKDAPVDGKDGRPHLGPFVETSAERGRKKAKESGDEAKVEKPKPSTVGTEASSEDGWKMPETNDGVMDDPNRTGPKEGTRGTEGGISEKSKDRKEGISDTKSEKKPDPPKEAPPLPHSEQESLVLGHKYSKEEIEKNKDALGLALKEKDEEKPEKELGGLEVIFSSRGCTLMDIAANVFDCRNPSTFLRSHTTFPFLNHPQAPKAIPSQYSSLSHPPFPCSHLPRRPSYNHYTPLCSLSR